MTLSIWFLPSALAALLVFVLLLYVWRHPPRPALRSWIVASLVGALLFCLGDLASMAAETVAADRAAGNVIYAGLALTAAALWMIALRTAQLQGVTLRIASSPVGWLPPIWLGLLWLSALTDPWHGHFATRVLGARSEYHALFYVFAASGYGLVGTGLGLLAYVARRTPGPLAWMNALTIGLAAAVIMLGSLAYVFWPTPLHFDPTGVGICVGSGLAIFGVYRIGPFALSAVPVSELLRQGGDGVILVDSRGRLLEWNAAAEAWLGGPVGFGAQLATLWEAQLAHVEHAERPLGGVDVERELLGDDQPDGGRLYRRVGENRTVRISSQPLRDARGGVLCRVLRLREETDLHRLSDALIEQATVLTVLLAATDEGIVVQVGDEIRYVNPQFHEIFQTPAASREMRTPQDLLKVSLSRLSNPDEVRARIGWLAREAHAVSRDDLELDDGRILEGTSLPLVQDGTPIGRVWRVRDATEQRRSEEALRSGQKLESLGVMAGGIAHDFNNLLVAVMGNAGLAMAELEPGSRIESYLRDIELAAERAGELTRQLLTYAGKGQVALEPVDLSSVVREVVDLIAVSIPKRIALRCELQTRLPAVIADAPQLRQVVMNLLLNAADAIEEGAGVITVTTAVETLSAADGAGLAGNDDFHPGRFVALRVADTGVGMEPSVRTRIFDPFFSTKFTGRGLGLAATLGIVRSHDGFLRVASEVGRGSTFTLLLPAREAVIASRDASGPGENTSWHSDATVLVVDDDPGVAKVAAAMLRRAGLEVVMAGGGDEALEVYAQRGSEIDVVLLDLTMPDRSGPETLSALRAMDPDVRAVLSSGYPEDAIAAQLARELDLLFIQKPYRAKDLLEQMRRALDA